MVFLLSGAPGLAAQLAWTRVFTGGLGHELPSLLGVVTAFFLGMAGGAWLWQAKLQARPQPARVYAGLELWSAAWIGLTTPWLAEVNELGLRWAGPDASEMGRAGLALILPLGVVGPAAAALGATLPAMERAVAPWLPDRRAVAGLYALNVFGALLGTLGSVFLAMPAWGFRGTLFAAGTVQLVLALVVIGITRGPGSPAPGSAPPPAPPRRLPLRWTLIAVATGCLGLGFELLGVRALAQLTENTLHTYAWSLSVFLLGTALGSAGLRAFERRGRAPGLEWLLAWLSLAVLAEIGVLTVVGRHLATIRAVLGGPGSELFLAAVVFLGPTLVMGALFARLTQFACDSGWGAGGVVGWNTLGAGLAAPLLLGAGLPWVGLKWALVSVAAGYGLLCRMAGQRWGRGHAALAVALVGWPMILPPRLALVEVPAGAVAEVLREGRLATVSVVRTADGHRTLRVNNRFQQGGTATATAAQRHAVLPLLLHAGDERPCRALFLGVGTGITLGAAAVFDRTDVEGVELLPEILGSLDHFEPENGGPGRRPNVRLISADARRFVRTTPRSYDVIMADLFHPSEDGAGFLYTREHFAAIRGRAAPGGLVCQWLPLHQLDHETFRTVVRTFLEVFPGTTLWLLRSNADLPVVGLVWVESGLRVDWEAVNRRLPESGAGPVLRAVALGDPLRVYGSLLAGPSSLREWAGTGPVATDDRPRVLFDAARAVYAGTPHAQRNLLGLIEELDPEFDSVAAGLGEEKLGPLRRYREARDRHLRGLVLETEGRRKEALEAYLASAAASPDYTAGYGQAVLIASAYRQEDPAFARALLERLIRVRPEQRLAREVLARFGP